MAEASQGKKTGDISDARDSEDEEVEEIRYRSVSTTSRRIDVGSGSRTQVFGGERNSTRRTSSIDTSRNLQNCDSLYWLKDGGGESSVAARTSATLSTKNWASLSAVIRLDDW